jgi:hypothetical protein
MIPRLLLVERTRLSHPRLVSMLFIPPMGASGIIAFSAEFVPKSKAVCDDWGKRIGLIDCDEDSTPSVSGTSLSIFVMNGLVHLTNHAHCRCLALNQRRPRDLSRLSRTQKQTDVWAKSTIHASHFQTSLRNVSVSGGGDVTFFFPQQYPSISIYPSFVSVDTRICSLLISLSLSWSPTLSFTLPLGGGVGWRLSTNGWPARHG